MYADVEELVDALDSCASALRGVEFQVLSSVPNKIETKVVSILFGTKIVVLVILSQTGNEGFSRYSSRLLPRLRCAKNSVGMLRSSNDVKSCYKQHKRYRQRHIRQGVGT